MAASVVGRKASCER